MTNLLLPATGIIAPHDCACFRCLIAEGVLSPWPSHSRWHVGIRWPHQDAHTAAVYLDGERTHRAVEAYAGRGGWVLLDREPEHLCWCSERVDPRLLQLMPEGNWRGCVEWVKGHVVVEWPNGERLGA